jgi:hypothetical protein
MAQPTTGGLRSKSLRLSGVANSPSMESRRLKQGFQGAIELITGGGGKKIKQVF